MNKLNATLFVSIISAMISVVSCVINYTNGKSSQKTDIINAQKFISERVNDFDKIIIENPEIQKTISNELNRKDIDYFKKDSINDSSLFKLKSFVYLNLNFYDELINIFERDSETKNFLEYDYWRIYIMYKMENPLFKEVYENEAKYFWGKNFQNFIIKNKKDRPLMMKVDEMKKIKNMY